MANYLITGGTGLIGRALIKRLQQSPATITVLTRDKKRAAQKLGYLVNLIESLEEIDPQENIEFVVNLAGEPIADKRWSVGQKMKIWQSRVELTNQIIQWMKKQTHKPQVLLSGSAVGWYGDGGSNELTETSMPHPEYQHELCKAWEEAALAAEAFEVRVCLLRTGLVVSSQGGFLDKMLLPFKLGLGARIGDGRQYMPWIHIDDMVNALMFMLDPNEEDIESCRGAFNLTAPTPVTNTEFTQTLARVVGKPSFLFVPSWFLNLALGEMARLLLTGQRAVPQKLQDFGFYFQFDKLEGALQEVLKKD
ncbi:TIGR01777 family protein [Aliikangiella marina]|uniref:TIGR01777 family protein n=1 Tax=Aliikangiella marina TaxID=1712262 RepID=A0A545THR1_9GAMM|nr:TIGR01777 family oxidoreductase [Aliikangiella marina]TQV76763.1 TIGR01777 family protein [Aliikangiella marina]